MKQIEFKYIPVGGTMVGASGTKYIKISRNEYCIGHLKHARFTSHDGDMWESDYELVAFKNVKPGEHIWYFNAGKDELETNEYIKVNDAHMSNVKRVSHPDVFGLVYPSQLVTVLRPAPSPTRNHEVNWIDKINLCKLSDLNIGDECMVQGSLHFSRIFTVQEIYPDTHHLHNDSGLYLLKDENGRKYFSTATQQVYRKPLPPPKLMLSALKAGTHFVFKHGWKDKEFIKLNSHETDRLYYRDYTNVVYWRPWTDDQEVVETIPF